MIAATATTVVATGVVISITATGLALAAINSLPSSFQGSPSQEPAEYCCSRNYSGHYCLLIVDVPASMRKLEAVT